MLKDITIGQFFPGTSPLHRMDPRMKIVLTVGYIVMLFLAVNPAALGVGVVTVLVCYLISRIPLKMIWKSMKPVVPIILFTGILNMFFVDGNTLLQVWFFRITDRGILYAITMAIRILCLIAGTSLLTLSLIHI